MSNNVATAASPEEPEDDSLNGIDLTQFGVPAGSLEGEDHANGRAPAGGGDEMTGEIIAALTLRVNQLQDQVKRLWEQLPRRVPPGEDDRWIRVTLLENGLGSDGTSTTAATWQYTATATIGGAVTTYGTTLTPQWPRPNGKMTKATKGIVRKTAGGTVTLEIAYEKPGTGTC